MEELGGTVFTGHADNALDDRGDGKPAHDLVVIV
jgi:hypothetical protein